MSGGRQLLDRLTSEAGPWTAPVEHVAEAVSTNDLLKARARAGAPAWSAILADRQTRGRGRHGREWVSAAGNLHVSVLLRPRLPAALQGLMPLVAGLAVVEALDGFGVEASLKWPNDVLVGESKIAGVLAEATSSLAGIESVVLGVGVNVAVAPAPPERATPVTSLYRESPQRPAVVDVAAAVLLRVRDRQADLERSGARVLSAWRDRAVRWWGERVEVVSAGEALRGRLLEVDDTGALVLDAEGRRCRVVAGEARRLRTTGEST